MAQPEATEAPIVHEQVEIESGQEPWCDIYLADGYKLRVRVVIRAVAKRVGQIGPGGSPVYDVDASIAVAAFPRKKRKD